MKRLAFYFSNMPHKTATYPEIYAGEVWVDGAVDHDPVYYHGEIGFEISGTHKLAQSKPTVRIMIPVEELGITDCSASAADHCLREFAHLIDPLNEELYNRARPDSENGKYILHRPGGEVLTRNSAYFAVCPQKGYTYAGTVRGFFSIRPITEGAPPPKLCLCFRMQVQLPEGNLRRAGRMLCHDLPEAVEEFVLQFDPGKLQAALDLSAKQAAIRVYLKTSPYCAFVANGSILPRLKGTQLPMTSAIPFHSTPDDEIEICGVRGMGIRRGVTVITGGGYSGKSTLLDAISAGIYNHCPGDGRELCITDDTAMTISAEDGRCVKSVNISPFIKWLPSGDTTDFSTDHASGSTSQAANIMEAVSYGARLLLIDEDRSATNFMIRDKMMKELIEKEPITPFTERVNELYQTQGVSTVLVIGGSGEYLAVADKIYMMDDYLIHDVTDRSKGICQRHGIMPHLPAPTEWTQDRVLYGENFTSYPEGMGSEKLTVSDMGLIFIGDEAIDVRGLHDIVSKRQYDALGFMLRQLEIRNTAVKVDLDAAINKLYVDIERDGLDIVFSTFFTTAERFLDLPRKCELRAVVDRMRKVKRGISY